MSRSISTALKNHFAENTTTVARMVKIKRLDGSIFAFTDHDQNISYDLSDGDGSQTYSAEQGHTPTASETTSSLEVDNLSIEGSFEISGLQRDALLQGYFDYAEVKFFYVNWNDLSQGDVKIQRGQFGRVVLEDNKFITDFEGLMAVLQHPVGRSIQFHCPFDLGDSDCGVDLTANTSEHPSVTYTSTGTVSSIITQQKVFRATIANAPTVSNWFDFGDIKWSAGNQNNLSFDVKTQTYISGTTYEITLDLPTIKDIEVGDTFTITSGCNKTPITHCKTRFNNVVNFGGFPDVPGETAAFQRKEAV